MAVLPADDPPRTCSARRPPGLRAQDRDRARVLPRGAQRRRHDRDRGQARHAREALLRHGRPDAAVRLPDDGLALLQRARLGQLRERPRGRERPVRAELRVRRRARRAATARSSSATWCTRSPSSTAGSRRSCRSRSRTSPATAATSTCRSGRTARTSSSTSPTRARPLGQRPTASSAASRPTPAPTSALTAPTVNSYKRLKPGLDLERRDLVAGLDLVRLQQPHPDAADPGARPDRGPHGRRLLQPVPGRGGGARGGPRRDRERARRRRAERREPLRLLLRRADRPRAAVATGEPARGGRRARARRRPPRRARAGAGRGLRRLLRAREARRVVPLPRAGRAPGKCAST